MTGDGDSVTRTLSIVIWRIQCETSTRIDYWTTRLDGDFIRDAKTREELVDRIASAIMSRVAQYEGASQGDRGE